MSMTVNQQQAVVRAREVFQGRPEALKAEIQKIQTNDAYAANFLEQYSNVTSFNPQVRTGLMGSVSSYTGNRAGAEFRGLVDGLESPQHAAETRDVLFESLNRAIV